MENLSKEEGGLKIEKYDYKSMIEGFEKDDQKIKTILRIHDGDLPNKFLLASLIGIDNYNRPPSKIGKDLFKGDIRKIEYPLELKYVAYVDTKISMKVLSKNNDVAVDLWDKLCSEGLWDNWEPKAPRNTWNKKSYLYLLRVYEVDQDFKKYLVPEKKPIRSVRVRLTFDNPSQKKVKFEKIRPVLGDEEFNSIKARILSFIRDKKYVEDYKLLIGIESLPKNNEKNIIDENKRKGIDKNELTDNSSNHLKEDSPKEPIADYISKEKLDEDEAKIISGVMGLPLEDIKRKITGLKPEKKNVITSQYVRNPYVVAFALKRCRGICELCQNKAPFIKSNGDFYLEVHHLVPLSSGGLDIAENVATLCPNCHRLLHHGKYGKEETERLIKRFSS